ncbi:plasmid mobilization protein [Albibacterium sp.]|uniref:plasmid mobilization protein n=1 Tax=Albibacterium sp. TaxID=2952885 RepID=UPI002B835AC6|nr:molybdopterin-guanine dinucleotide biosynthesis protein MobB [Albibacterium sp.]HUH18561.1 hypothetical protein [Albibacterium sp.]
MGSLFQIHDRKKAPDSRISKLKKANKMKYNIQQNIKKGRPRITDKKLHLKSVRYNEKQYRIVLDNAKNAGMKPSEWIRESSIKTRVKPRFSTEDRKVLHVLAGVSNNLNQLTALSHQAGMDSFKEKCQKVIDEISNYLKLLSDDR